MTATASSAADGRELELAVRALGLGFSTYSDGCYAVNAYDAGTVENLERLGFRCQHHERFPGRVAPGSFWDCTYSPAPAIDEPELSEAESAT